MLLKLGNKLDNVTFSYSWKKVDWKEWLIRIFLSASFIMERYATIWLFVLGFVFISLCGYFSILLSPALHYRASQFASPRP